jgi:hypothetical protein
MFCHFFAKTFKKSYHRSQAETGNANGNGNGTAAAAKGPEPGHSRQSSVASSHSTESGKLSLGGGAAHSVASSGEELGDCHHGVIVALHRKMVSRKRKRRASAGKIQRAILNFTPGGLLDPQG